jgi:putative ABC transport system permease protein
MNPIIFAFRRLFRKSGNNSIKILSLGIGLAGGLVLIAKVYFEQSFDSFFPNNDRVYRVAEHYIFNGELGDHPLASGGVAPGFAAEIPEVEAATRFTALGSDTELVFYDREKNKYNATVLMGDSCLFDVLSRPVLAGDPKEVLARPLYAMVSRKVADMLGGVDAAVGQGIVFDSYPGKTITIGGVFEDIPINSHINYTVMVSLSSISNFMYDGRDNWMGNDRYFSYVMLRKGVDPEALIPSIRAMEARHHDQEALKKSGIELTYRLSPVRDIHRNSDEVRRMSGLLSILAFALIFTAVMNYILIVISSLVARSKEMAARKCYGASAGNIYGVSLAETLVDVIIAVVGAVFIIALFRGTVKDILGTAPEVMLNLRSGILLGGVCLAVILAAGIVPGYMFSHVPVASVFRKYRESKRRWKLGLLFLQIVAAGFLVSLLVVIIRQYDLMLKDNPGYSYEQLAYSNLVGVNGDQRLRVIEELGRMPEVDKVTGFSSHPYWSFSGNNVSLPGSDQELFNIADGYFVGNDYFEIMEIPIVDGRSFTENVENSDEILISRSFAEKMKMFSPEWNDGAVGKQISLSEHGLKTVCGVYENFRIGSIGHEDSRPTVFFYHRSNFPNILIKFHKLTPEGLQRVTEEIQRIIPDKDISVESCVDKVVERYVESRRFRDAVLIGSIVTLIITLAGLIGYTRDEINRRRKETAIRKINGATMPDILRMFMGDVSRVAIPAVVIGGGLSAYMSFKWLEQFSIKASLSPAIFILSALTVTAIALCVVIINCYQVASANPADSIKIE